MNFSTALYTSREIASKSSLIISLSDSIRGVGYYRPDGRYFHGMSNTFFGPLAKYTGFFKLIMKRKMNEKQEAESLFIRKWCLTIIDFIYSDNVIQTDLIELIKQAFDEETETKYLELTTPGIYLKGLRQAFNDINDMALNAPNQILEKLNNTLFAQFGKDLSAYSQNTLSRLEEIVKRGEIINDEEFRIVEQKVSDISQIDGQSQQITILNNLLVAYYISKR